MKPMGNTAAGQKHAKELDDHVQQTKTYGGHIGMVDPGAKGTGFSSQGAFPRGGSGAGGASTGADYQSTSVNDAPAPDGGADAPPIA